MTHLRLASAEESSSPAHDVDQAVTYQPMFFVLLGLRSTGRLRSDDAHATVVLETTVGIGDRRHHGRYVDVYRLRDGTAIEHWHLPFDPSAEAAFFGR